MLYLVLFFLTKYKKINETRSKPICIKYFGLFKFEKIAVREIKSARKLVQGSERPWKTWKKCMF